MKPVRQNTLVVDTSVLPKRPSPVEIKEFFDKKLFLDMSNVKRIQLHTIKNVVYLGMRDMSVAQRIAADHHLKHHMTIGGKEVPIPVPVYIETSATDVRLHDLPEEIDTNTIIQHMSQYGEVISISDELWKNFWPGFSNGVTIVRMRLERHIPSFVNFPEFDDSSTLVTYRNQIKTCSRCNRKSHPKQRCSEAASSEHQNSSDEPPQTNTSTLTLPTQAVPTALNEQSFPSLPNNTPKPVTTNAEKQPTASKPARVKRQHTVEEEQANKKPSGSDSRPLYEYSFDQQAIYDESVRLNECSHVTDPIKRKEMLWYYAGRYVENNKLKLQQQEQEQHKQQQKQKQKQPQ